VSAIDYDDRLHARYVHGSRLAPEVFAAWVVAFGHWLPERRPFAVSRCGIGDRTIHVSTRGCVRWPGARDRAIDALARVVRPDGVLLLRTSPSDFLARPWWDEWLPEVYETDRTLLPSLSETVTTITSAGWEYVAIDEVAIPSVLTRRQDFERLSHRSLSTLEHLDDSIVDGGLERIAAAVAADPHADQPAPIAPQHLLVFRHL